MLGFPILYLKGMRIMMFQLSGFYYNMGFRAPTPTLNLPRGSIYTTIMELGLKNHNGDGLLGPNSIVVVYMDPLG